MPSFFVWVVAGAALAASLFALYRISAEPSFFVGPAAVDAAAGFVADVVAGLALAVVVGLAVEVVAGFFVFAGVICAFEYTLIPVTKKKASKIFFINDILFQLV